MTKSRVLLQALSLVSALAARAGGQVSSEPDTVVVRSGVLELHALLWRPEGHGLFPAVLFNHGSGPAGAPLAPQRTALGPLFAGHGYVFLFLFRRGAGLSANEGANSFDLMNQEFAERWQEARNQVQIQLHDDLSDALAGLAFLRGLPEVDTRRVAMAGHLFGGSLTLLLAERDTMLRAAIVFSAAGYSWERSPPLRARLLAAVGRTTVPVFFLQAANDYSVAPAEVLSAEMALTRGTTSPTY